MDKRSADQMQTTVEKTLVRHILIKTNAMTSDLDAEQRLRGILQKIKNGDDFAKLASAHSADLGSASNGGSLGWVTHDVLVPEFSSKMQTLAVNEISEPFQSPFGWHIMQVMDRKVQNDDQAALRQKAKAMIQQRKYEEKLQTWGRQLRDEAYVITYYDKTQ
jgi:peptidyl-prolyl cis-trans isomerase SurA